MVNVYKALITKAKRWKHRCPVIDEWINVIFPHKWNITCYRKQQGTNTYNMDELKNIKLKKPDTKEAKHIV